MKPIKLKINTKTQQYSIIIGSNLVSNISKILKENSINFKQCLLIIDKNISKINITPLADRVIIKQEDAETTTASGIIIPDTAQEKPQKGSVIAI